MVKYFEIDEYRDAVRALETCRTLLSSVEEDLAAWKWVIVALHNSVQGFMVCALMSSDKLVPLNDKVAEEWMLALRTGKQLPPERLDTFLNLYRKIQKKHVGVHYKPFEPEERQNRSMQRLNRFRNRFMHFNPQSWLVGVDGLPQLVLDCLDVVEHLGWQSGNFSWHSDPLRRRAEAALQGLRDHLAVLGRRKDCS